MRTPARIGGWATLAALAVIGCRAPSAGPSVDSSFTPAPPPAAPELPITQYSSLVPDVRTLPTVDPREENVPSAAPTEAVYRGLTEEACRTLAAAHSPAAGLIERENEVPPTPPPTNRREARRSPPVPCDDLFGDLREYAAADARNTAATDALEQFFRLADTEGRAELLRETVPLIDELRARVSEARAGGVRVPTDPDELDRQRAQMLALIGQADLGSTLLNIDLKRRIGYPGRGPDRLWPTGPFPVTADPVDVDAAVQVALERRPDLQLLRAAYAKLTPETLPAIRDVLRGYEPHGSGIGVNAIAPETVQRFLLGHHRHGDGADAAIAAELEVRRQQLYDLTAAKERQAADEVRAAAATLTAQTRQVALARWRAEQLAAALTDAKEKKQGPLVELPAAIEAIRTRAEVVAAVYAWHQARIKLAGAQGLLSSDAVK